MLLEKVARHENAADALTKYLDSATLTGHLERMGLVLRDGKPLSAPQLATSVVRSLSHEAQALKKEKEARLQPSPAERDEGECPDPLPVSNYAASYVACSGCQYLQLATETQRSLCEGTVRPLAPSRYRKTCSPLLRGSVK